MTGAARASGITIQGDLPAALANYRRDLTITERLAEAQRDQATATERRRAAFDILSAMDRRGLHLSPDDRQLLDRLRAVFDSL